VAKAVGCAVVDARLDYANSVVHGISQYILDRLQRIQNLLARIVAATVRCHPAVTSQKLLIQLHWLPIKYRSQYKLAILTYRSQSLTAPLYLSSLFSRYQPPCISRSSSDRFL
jgi:hypothetical protein